MKIIDKIQDFYEYDAYMYGEPDKSIIWDRNTHIYNFRYDFSEMMQQKIESIVNKFIYKDESLNGYPNYKNDAVLFTQSLVGIYPYVYLCMNFGTYALKCGTHLTNKLYTITESEFKDRVFLTELITVTIDNKKAYLPGYLRMQNIDKEFSNYSFYGNVFYKEYNDSWIQECPELFKLLDTPTFEIRFTGNKIIEITKDAIIINTLLLKQYSREDLDQNIYSNIEQFIVNKNIEEIKEPDNKTKIVNAGFDLKTSFRNM